MAADVRDAEFALLLACARLVLDPATEQRAVALVARGLDWERLYALADKHGLRPLLFRHLGEGRLGPIPPTFESKLWRHAEQLRRRNRQMESALVELSDRLRGAGIPVLAHKGPVVARRAYGDAALREYGDLDLLLPHADMRRAISLLAEDGYLPKFPLSPAAEGAFLAASSQYHFMLVHGDTGLLVELHWKTDNDYPVEASDRPGWWQRGSTLEIQGQAIACLPADEFLLALCLHGSKHYWGSLHWLVDVAELLRGLDPGAWAGMLERVRGLQAERRLALALVLASKNLEVPAPLEVSTWALAVPAVRELAVKIARGWPRLNERPPGAMERLRLDFLLCDLPGQRARHLLRTLFLPGLKEWSRWPLPRALHFLYIPLRMGGLFAKRTRRALIAERDS